MSEPERFSFTYFNEEKHKTIIYEQELGVTVPDGCVVYTTFEAAKEAVENILKGEAR